MPSFDALTVQHQIPEGQVDLLARHLGGFPAEVTDPLRAIFWFLSLLPWERQAKLLRTWLIQGMEAGSIGENAAARAVLEAVRPELDVLEMVRVTNQLAPHIIANCGSMNRNKDGSYALTPRASREQAAWLAVHHACRALSLQSLPRKSVRVLEITDPEETVASDIWHVLAWGILVLPLTRQDGQLEDAIREVTAVTADWLAQWCWSRGIA